MHAAAAAVVLLLPSTANSIDQPHLAVVAAVVCCCPATQLTPSPNLKQLLEGLQWLLLPTLLSTTIGMVQLRCTTLTAAFGPLLLLLLPPGHINQAGD